MRKLHRSRVRGGRGVKAVAFIYFTGLALPVLFLSAAFSVDFTRIIIVNRAMSNAAAAAAAAGSWQMEPGRAAIATDAARTAAGQTMCRATEAVRGASARGETLTSCADGRQVSADVTFKDFAADVAGYPANGYTTVQVKSEYTINHMIFFFYFNQQRSARGVAVQQASVCMPGDSANYSGGYCTRPE